MPTILQNIGKYLMHPYLNMLCRTVSVEKINFEEYNNFRNSGKQFILIFWHGTMLQAWYSERPTEKEKIFSFASRSPDGELAVNVFKNWKYNFVRGSSRDGADEVKEVVEKKILEGYSLCIVPDGPTGPNRKMKFGAIKFAQKNNLPIFILAVSYKNKRIFNSWDKFELPKFYTKSYFVFSEPIFVDKNISDLTETKLKIENYFSQLQIKADNCIQ